MSLDLRISRDLYWTHKVLKSAETLLGQETYCTNTFNVFNGGSMHFTMVYGGRVTVNVIISLLIFIATLFTCTINNFI